MAVGFDNRHAGDAIAIHDIHRVADAAVGRHRHRVDDHARFAALHLVDFVALRFDGKIFVNDADTALLGDGDGQVRFGHGIHRR